MSEPKGKPEGEHIEELLSQLKGIFGHLSETEQAEAKEKITPPPVSHSTPPPEAAPPAAAPPPEVPQAPPEEGVPLAPLSPPSAPPAEPAAEFTPAEVAIPSGATLTPTAVFYPGGRMNEAKIVTGKVEKITPKFTKVSVVLNVQSLASYDVKADIKTAILSQLEPQIKAVFILIDKPLDEARRKAIATALEPKGIYFQEIPFHQIEKKALYTDMLLGMVFFFDSQKKTPGETTE
ncbi:MAG: hypothetical protein A2992_08950 [Elusimicrobia bacterium RIFCSPLOWO2_01_FULL_59_12]|nr:MAG: hypothetical protein A2992_08950 [Elusimicrobia bacterium RIFCSPLOWO2_01_FULL_59_12]